MESNFVDTNNDQIENKILNQPIKMQNLNDIQESNRNFKSNKINSWNLDDLQFKKSNLSNNYFYHLDNNQLDDDKNQALFSENGLNKKKQQFHFLPWYCKTNEKKNHQTNFSNQLNQNQDYLTNLYSIRNLQAKNLIQNRSNLHSNSALTFVKSNNRFNSRQNLIQNLVDPINFSYYKPTKKQKYFNSFNNSSLDQNLKSNLNLINSKLNQNISLYPNVCDQNLNLKSSLFNLQKSKFPNLNSMFAVSSVPGLREICVSKNYFRKIIWMLAFILFSFLALNDIQQLFSDFYSYPITVDLRLRENRKLPFPSVTVCNLNIVRYSALCNSTLNISMPIGLQEKLCGLSLTLMKNNSFEDINDILPDSDYSTSTSTTTQTSNDDYPNYNDEIYDDYKHTTMRTDSNKKKHRKTNKKTNKSNNPASLVTNINSNSNSNRASSSAPEIQKNFEMIDLTEHEEKELQENLTTWLAVMANKNKNLTFSLGHQFDDMVLRCTIKSANCTHHKSFVSSFTPTEGNCYTFVAKINLNPIKSPLNLNDKISMSTTTENFTISTETTTRMSTNAVKTNPPLQVELFTTKKPPDLPVETNNTSNKTEEEYDSNHIETILAGSDHGLELVINLEKNEYLPVTSQLGAMIMIHSPNDFGISASEAIMVSPEYATYIGLKMVRISRLPAPYPEQCVDIWPKSLQRKSISKASYSQQACIKICLQKTIQKRCKCQSAFLEQVELNDTEFRICDTRKRNIRRCVEGIMLRKENKLDDCKCPPRCHIIQYEKTVSLAKWQNKEDKVSFDRDSKDVDIQNVAKVVVYFQTMTLQEINQQPAWNTGKLFSSLGGFMGMYVGFSFLSLFEVFEIFSRRIWHILKSRNISFKSLAIAILIAIKLKKKKKSTKTRPKA